jgi:hypothetical protein
MTTLEERLKQHGTHSAAQLANGHVVRIWQKTIYLGGIVRTQGDAEELIAIVAALKPMLPVTLPGQESFAAPPPSPTTLAEPEAEGA